MITKIGVKTLKVDNISQQKEVEEQNIRNNEIEMNITLEFGESFVEVVSQVKLLTSNVNVFEVSFTRKIRMLEPSWFKEQYLSLILTLMVKSILEINIYYLMVFTYLEIHLEY